MFLIWHQHVWFCCKEFSQKGDRLPSRAFDFLLGAFKDYVKTDASDFSEKENFVVRKVPSYVNSVLEGQRLTQSDWREIQINRITVVYERH